MSEVSDKIAALLTEAKADMASLQAENANLKLRIEAENEADNEMHAIHKARIEALEGQVQVADMLANKLKAENAKLRGSEVTSHTRTTPMTEHTPGPWEVRPDPSHYDSMSEVYPVGSDVMIAATGGEIKTMESNARLIAAAPELLEDAQAYREVARNAISDLYAIMMISTSHPQDIYDFALACRKSHWERLEAIDDRAAIAKAKGEK